MFGLFHPIIKIDRLILLQAYPVHFWGFVWETCLVSQFLIHLFIDCGLFFLWFILFIFFLCFDSFSLSQANCLTLYQIISSLFSSHWDLQRTINLHTELQPFVLLLFWSILLPYLVPGFFQEALIENNFGKNIVVFQQGLITAGILIKLICFFLEDVQFLFSPELVHAALKHSYSSHWVIINGDQEFGFLSTESSDESGVCAVWCPKITF